MAGQEIPIATNLRADVLEQIVGDKFWKRGWVELCNSCFYWQALGGSFQGF